MSNKTVEDLMKSVKELHDSVLRLKADVRWIKLGMIGTISSLVVTFGAILAALITLRH